MADGESGAAGSLSPADGGRIGWIDAARGLGILLVALCHTWGLSPDAKKVVYSFHMPLFFFLSGLVFSPARPTGIRSVLAGKHGILAPWILFAAAGCLRFPVEPRMIPHGRDAWVDAAVSFLHGAPFTNLPLWFLVSLALVSVVFAVVARRTAMFRTGAGRIAFLAVCAGLALAVSRLSPETIKCSPLMLATVPAGLVWYASGAFSRRWTVRSVAMVPRLPLLLLAIAFLGALIAFLGPVEASSVYSMRIRSWRFFPSSFLGIAATICLAAAVGCPLRSVLAFVGRHSLVFFALDYVIRPYVWHLVRSVVPAGTGPTATVLLYLTFHMSVAAALCLPAERLLSRFRKGLSAVVPAEPPRA